MVIVNIGQIYSYVYSQNFEILDLIARNFRFIKDPKILPFIQANSNWDGIYNFFTLYEGKKSGRLLTGFVPRLLHFLRQHDIPYAISDKRQAPRIHRLGDLTIDLYDYQKEVVDILLSNSLRRGIIDSKPRSGKTVMAIAFVNASGAIPHLFVVERDDLLVQTKEKFEQFAPHIQVGEYSGKIKEFKDVTVATIQALNRALSNDDLRIKNFIKNVRSVWVDEAHHAGASSYRNILKRLEKAYFIYGGTGTPYGEHSIFVEGYIGPILKSIDYDELIDCGALVPPKIIFIKRPAKYAIVEQYDVAYKEFIVNNTYRNVLIKEIVQKLLSKNLTGLVIVKMVEHGELLSNLLSVPFVWGESSRKIRQKIWEELRTTKGKLAITTVADEGLDIPALDFVINAAAGKSIIKSFQRLRCLTADKNKSVGYYIDFKDPEKWFLSQARQRIKNLSSKFKVVEVAPDKIEEVL